MQAGRLRIRARLYRHVVLRARVVPAMAGVRVRGRRAAVLAAILRRSRHRAAALRVTALASRDLNHAPPRVRCRRSCAQPMPTSHPPQFKRLGVRKPVRSEKFTGSDAKACYFAAVHSDYGGRGTPMHSDYGGARNAHPRAPVYTGMLRATACVAALAAAAGMAVAAEAPLPDPAYCSLRDADPAKCVIRDTVPVPFVVPTPAAAAPAAGPDYCGLRDADPRYCVIQDGAASVRRAAPGSASVGSSAAQLPPPGTAVVPPPPAPATPVSPSTGTPQPAPGASSFGGSANTPSALVPPPPSVLFSPVPQSTDRSQPLPGASSFGGSASTPSALVPPSVNQSGAPVPGTSVISPAAPVAPGVSSFGGSASTPVAPGASSFGGSASTPSGFAPPRNAPQAPASRSTR